MSFNELIKTRYSVRNYSDKKVEQEKIDLILEAANIAPTGANRQGQRLIILKSSESMNKLTKAANLHGAPMAIIVCVDRNNVWTRSYDNTNLIDIDASIVTTHMMLQATDLGLGTLWVCMFRPDVLAQEFDIPSHLVPVNILGIGYAEGPAKSTNRFQADRKGIENILLKSL